MNTQELILIKDIIEGAVTKAIKPLQEELKKIKAIAATTLKEGRERPTANVIQEAPILRQLPNVGNILLEHTPSKNSQQIQAEKSNIIGMAMATGDLPQVEVSEDLIMSMLKG